MWVGVQETRQSVTPEQWIAASSCILGDIIEDYTGNVTQLSWDYMAYTSRRSGSWSRTIYLDVSYRVFDDEYQPKSRIKFKFRWGSDSPHLHCHFSLPRMSKVGDRPRRQELKRKNVPQRCQGREGWRADRVQSRRGESTTLLPVIKDRASFGITDTLVKIRVRTPMSVSGAKSPTHTKVNHDARASKHRKHPLDRTHLEYQKIQDIPTAPGYSLNSKLSVWDRELKA